MTYSSLMFFTEQGRYIFRVFLSVSMLTETRSFQTSILTVAFFCHAEPIRLRSEPALSEAERARHSRSFGRGDTKHPASKIETLEYPILRHCSGQVSNRQCRMSKFGWTLLTAVIKSEIQMTETQRRPVVFV